MRGCERVGKRGVSPLIATILLIAFAVALGSVIMNWGLSLSANNQKDKCSKAEIALKPINSLGADACYGGSFDSGYINFIIQNSGSADIAGVSVWLTGEKGSELIDFSDVSIPRGSEYEKKGQGKLYDYDRLGQLLQVQLIPKVLENGKKQACTKSAVDAERVMVC